MNEKLKELTKDKNFNELQIREIKVGLEKGLDVELYAYEKLNHLQMRKVRIGLMHNINVSVYNTPIYNEKQMGEILYGLINNIDVSPYCDASLDYIKMNYIRKHIQAGTLTKVLLNKIKVSL